MVFTSVPVKCAKAGKNVGAAGCRLRWHHRTPSHANSETLRHLSVAVFAPTHWPPLVENMISSSIVYDGLSVLSFL